MENKIDVVTPPLKDKSLWLSVLVPLALMVAKVAGVELSEEFVSKAMDLVLAFILGSKGASVAKAFAVAKMEGQKSKPVDVPTLLDVGNGK